MESEIAIDPQKVKEIVDYLSSYLLMLPSFNSIRPEVQEAIMNFYDMQNRKSISEEEKIKYNNLLQQTEAPDYLLL